MKYFVFIIFFLLFTIIQSHAKEKIVISGKYKIENPLFFENKTIIIERNTDIYVNTDAEYAMYLKNSELYISGEILNPITIKSKKIDGEQNVIYLEDSKASIKSAIFEHNGWCLHAHNSDIFIENTHFRKNFGGIRFFNSKTIIKKNIFENSEIAMRFLNSNENDITKNIFYYNKIAIFIREGIQKDGIKENAFIKNDYDFYIGFFQSHNLTFPNNYFYDRPSIFDQTKDPDLTSVININPKLSEFPNWH